MIVNIALTADVQDLFKSGAFLNGFIGLDLYEYPDHKGFYLLRLIKTNQEPNEKKEE